MTPEAPLMPMTRRGFSSIGTTGRAKIALEDRCGREHILLGKALQSAYHKGVSSPHLFQGGAMSLQDRIESLRARHRSLEDAIDQEIHRPLPNDDLLHDLKRQKLRIKDEIVQLEHTG